MQAGERLDTRVAVDAGLATTSLLAAQVLVRWLARHLRRTGAPLDVAAVVDAGLVDYVPQDARDGQARWLLGLVARDAEAPAVDTRDPRPVGAGDLTALIGSRGTTGSGRAAVRARPSRARERSDRHVAVAIPESAMRAPHRTAFMNAVSAAPALAHRRRDFFENVLKVAWQLALATDWAETRCASPTWERLGERAGVKRATVGRALAALQDAGLVGVVATGQSGYTTTTKADEGRNLAAVYVLCTPRPSLVVDVTETPPTEGLQRTSVHAGAREHNTPPAPLRGLPSPAARSGPSQSTVPDSPLRPTDPRQSPTSGQDKPAARSIELVKGVYPGNSTIGDDDSTPDDATSASRRALIELTGQFVDLLDAGWSTRDLRAGRDAPVGTRPPRRDGESFDPRSERWSRQERRAARLAMAELLRRNCPPLRAMRTADVAVVIEEFVFAGWSARDLHHALDHRPDGSQHRGGTPTDGDGAPDRTPWRMRGWITWRLSQWRGPDGSPVRSKAQRAQAEHHAAVARSRARADQRERDLSWRPSSSSTISQQVRAQAHAVADRLRRERESRFEPTP